MAKNTIADLDTTAGNNTDILGQSTQGTAAVSTIDTMIQNALGMLARYYADLGGTGTVGGTADAITLTTASTYQTLEAGLFVGFKAGGTNTGATTINVDGLGAKAIRRRGDSALQAGDILDDGVYLLRYDTAYNAAAGAWVLLNPEAAVSFASTTEILTGTDTAKAANANGIAALWEKGSDEASAGTVAFGEGGFFHITGTTTITDIDFDTAKDGRTVDVVFDGVLTLTHNGTTLTLPGGRNITTAAGDRARFVQDSTDNVICLFYQPYIAIPPYITPWVAYTPTFTGFGTATGIVVRSRRVGDTLELDGKFIGGTGTPVEGQMTLGFNGTNGSLTTDSTKVPSIMLAGSGFFLGNATSIVATVLAESGAGYVTFGVQGGGSFAGLTKVNGSVLLASGQTLGFTARIPITGW